DIFDQATATLAKATTAHNAADVYKKGVDASAAAGSEPGKFSGKLNFQIGASGSETMEIDLSTQMAAMQTALGGVSTRYNPFGAAKNVAATELTADGSANLVVDKLQTAIESLGAVRSSLGAAANRLDHVNTNL